MQITGVSLCRGLSDSNSLLKLFLWSLCIKVQPGPVGIGQGVMTLKWKRVGLDGILKEILHCECDETLEVLAQKTSGCLIPGSVLEEVGWDFAQLSTERCPWPQEVSWTRWSLITPSSPDNSVILNCCTENRKLCWLGQTLCPKGVAVFLYAA